MDKHKKHIHNIDYTNTSVIHATIFTLLVVLQLNRPISVASPHNTHLLRIRPAGQRWHRTGRDQGGCYETHPMIPYTERPCIILEITRT